MEHGADPVTPLGEAKEGGREAPLHFTFFAYWHISYVRTEMNGPAVTGFLDGSLNAMRGRK